MKRFILVLCLGTALAIGSAAAVGIHVKPMAALDLGVGNYLRGGSLGGQAYLSLGGLWLGIEPRVEYDTAYGVAAIPVTLDLGLGSNFWLMAGTTLGPSISISGGGITIPMQYSGFFNTFGLGVNWFSGNIGIGKLGLFSEVTYTMTSPVNTNDVVSNAIGSLAGALLGLKAYVGISLDVAFL